MPLAIDDLDGIVAFCREQGVGWSWPGPSCRWCWASSTGCASAGIKAVGPSGGRGRLEGSKAFAKDFCARHGIPTARYRVFRREQAAAARAYVRAEGAPIVVKADGLAAGKGVVASTVAEAEARSSRRSAALRRGRAHGRVEECLEGEEASLFALVDGATCSPFGTAQDYKRACEGEPGPQHRRHGACAPAPA